MSAKYSRIMQAERLKRAKDEYDKWAKMTGEERSALYAGTKASTQNKKTSRDSVTGYVRLFTSKLSDDIWATTKVLAETSTLGDSNAEETESQMLSHINEIIYTGGYASRTPGVGVVTPYVSPSKLARVTVVKIGAKNPNGVVSRITKQKYTYRKRDSMSSPFGQKTGGTATQTFEDSTTALLSAFRAKDTSYKCYFKNQGFTGAKIITTPPTP